MLRLHYRWNSHGQGSLKELVQFLHFVKNSSDKEMSESTRNRFEVAVGKSNASDEDGTSDSLQDDESLRASETGNDQDAKQAPAAKKPRNDSPQNKFMSAKPVKSTKSHHLQHQLRTVSSDDLPAGEYLGKDKYGVIPFFNQIEDLHEVLGEGRLGSVKKISWGETFAAVKEYMNTDHDDRRYFFDIFKHERGVLFDLRTLWGKYVPAILFHKPWPTSPLLGLQLGEPMIEDDTSRWSKEDQELAKEARDEVAKLGWAQTDDRGANYIRLTARDGKNRWL